MPEAPRVHRHTRPVWTRDKAADQRALTGRPWRRVRQRVMQRDCWLCQVCLERGRVTVATDCDHIKPLADGGTDDESNLQALCRRCHDIKTALESSGSQYWPDWLPMPACPVILVTGPPGAGKTTFASARATRDDTVIDLDECFADVCGVHGHTADRSFLPAAIRWRNRQLADLSRRMCGRAFFIVTAPTDAEVAWWRTRLNAEHVCLDPGETVAMSRVDSSRQIHVRRWYESHRRNEWLR